MIEELAEHRELLFAYVLQPVRDLCESLDLPQRSPRDRYVVRLLRAMSSTVALHDVRRNRDRGASNLAREAIHFVAREGSRNSVGLEGEGYAFLPDNELAVIGDGHGVGLAEIGFAWRSIATLTRRLANRSTE